MRARLLALWQCAIALARMVVVEGSQRIVKITPDVYAFMLNYCRRGFTDVYADLRFVLSAGTHCPGIIIPLRHSRREEPKFRISFASWKILHQRHGTSRGSFRPRQYQTTVSPMCAPGSLVIPIVRFEESMPRSKRATRRGVQNRMYYHNASSQLSCEKMNWNETVSYCILIFYQIRVCRKNLVISL